MSQDISLGQLLQFINQPQSRAGIPQIPNLPQFGEGSNKYEQQMLAQDRLKRKNAQASGNLLRGIYGDQKGEHTPYDQTGDLFPGEGPIPGLENIASADTGMFDESVPFQRRLMQMNKGLGTSGDPTLMDQWAKNQGNMQSSMLSQIAASGRNAEDNQVKMDLARFKQEHPKQTALSQNIEATGLERGTAPFQERMSKQLTAKPFESSDNKAFGTSALKNWMTPDGEALQYGNPGMAKRGEIVLKNQMKAGDAGKLADINSAIDGFKEIDAYMFKDGVINEGVVKDMWLKDLSSTTGDFIQKVTQPFVNSAMSPEGQAVSSAYERGVQAITRAMTGAEMPQGEILNTKSRFQPEPGEDPRVSAWKYDVYKNFIRNVKKYISPINRDNPNASSYDLVNAGIDKAFSQNPLSSYIKGPKNAPTLKNKTDTKWTTNFDKTNPRIGQILVNPNGPEKARYTGKGDPNLLYEDDANWEEF